jgi:hypothetical protein
VGDAATEDGLWLWNELLATIARLEELGIWQPLHFVLLDWLARYGQLDWSRAIMDGSSVREVFGGARRDRILLIGPSQGASGI